MSSDNGLIGAQAYRKPGVPYYLQDGGEAVIRQPTLVAPITLESFDENGRATMSVSGFSGGVPYPYTGAVNISPGGSSLGPASDGLTVRSVAGGAQVEVGTNGQAVNNLMIAGASGLSLVYDETYNQPVALQAITLSATNPLAAPDPANVGEIFRCAQAGVAASAVGAIGTNFAVPKTGWYCLQLEIALGNAPAPAAPDINVPIAAVGGIDIGETLSFVITKGVVVEPYGAMEYVAQEFAAADIVVAGGNVIKQFVSQHLFTAGQTYTFTLKSSSALWNIGTNGQIKAELIAMC